MTTMTPDKARNAILDIALTDAVFDGWTDVMLEKAAVKAGLPDGAALLYFPDGVIGAIRFWSRQMDERAREEIKALDLSEMKIRDRVTQSVIIRLSQIKPEQEDAAQRAQSRLALPDGLGAGASITWSAADMIWRAIGDTSDDFNYYSKRAVLSAVLASTAPVWLNDRMPDKPDAKAFLERRIENVMQFEGAKARVRKAAANAPTPGGLLGRLRQGRFQKGVPTRRHKRRVRRSG